MYPTTPYALTFEKVQSGLKHYHVTETASDPVIRDLTIQNLIATSPNMLVSATQKE